MNPRTNFLLRLVAFLLVVLTVYLLIFQKKLIHGFTEKYFFTGHTDVVIKVTKLDDHKKERTQGGMFPRLYDSPKCDRSVNKSVSANVCKLLGASISDAERRTYLDMLVYFDNLAKKHNWTYFIGFGTLLGSWRHHGFVPYDQDVDLYIDYKHRKDIVNVIEEQTRFIPKQMVTDSIKIYDSKRIVGGAYYPNVGRWWAPDLDCFFYKQDATRIFRSDEPNSFVMKKSNVFPIHLRPFEQLNLPAPRNTLQILVDLYGNTSSCKRYASSYKPVECHELSKFIPFVHREFKDGKMEEKLVLDQKVIHTKMIQEPKTSVTKDPFTLRRPSGK